jgi:deoxyribodipyrimidine photo-lyase
MMALPKRLAPIILWFRNDLRLSDNPALHAAASISAPLICVYIHEKPVRGQREVVGAALWWLHGSLADLNQSLKKFGGQLHVFAGVAEEVIGALVQETGASAVYWNRRYDEAGREIDAGIKAASRNRDVAAESFNASLLHEPWTVMTQAGTPFRVFTPYWREALQRGDPPAPLPVPIHIAFADLPDNLQQRFAYPSGLEADPQTPDWASGLREIWKRSEEGAKERLASFLDDDLKNYAPGRDRLDLQVTSRISPYLRFGNISIRQVWHALASRQHSGTAQASDHDVQKFKSELGWREFSYSLLYHCPLLHRENIQRQFDRMPWQSDKKALIAWQKGRTGYPVVDAAMCQLWLTGTMHNRARMIVGSFLVKHLLIDWREGEAWFWNTLVDADPANNPASWQWVAGTGADAAPYFRILNPILQGQKFDVEGAYVKRWLPVLEGLPASVVHRPWAASKAELAAAGVRLGENYPQPIVDHDFARKRALATWNAMRREVI